MLLLLDITHKSQKQTGLNFQVPPKACSVTPQQAFCSFCIFYTSYKQADQQYPWPLEMRPFLGEKLVHIKQRTAQQVQGSVSFKHQVKQSAVEVRQRQSRNKAILYAPLVIMVPSGCRNAFWIRVLFVLRYTGFVILCLKTFIHPCRWQLFLFLFHFPPLNFVFSLEELKNGKSFLISAPSPHVSHTFNV